ncbi:MAG TPA: hypothetical protein VGA02_12770, partial [Gemmatimonadales bacterium]
AAALAAAAYVYLVRERLGLVGAGLAALRAAAFVTLLALLANAGLRRSGRAGPTTVALDASLSMQLLEGAWAGALDTAVAMAGRDGHVVRFGTGTEPFDSAPPEDGRSRVGDALRLAAARGGPAIVVTDGELEDLATVPAALRERLRLVLLPRAERPGLAVTEAAAPERVLAGDSLTVTVELTTWGGLGDSAGTLTIRRAGTTLLQRAVSLPPSPGRGRRTVTLPPRVLGSGVHVLEIDVRAAGDPERRDDTRLRVVTVAALPAAVLVARPLDWEARFLARELADLAPGGVEAFGDLGGGRWVDLRTQARVGAARVESAIRGAAVVLVRGAVPGADRARRVWRWSGGGSGGMAGDWYVAANLPTSPLVPRLAGLAWDSLPPLRGMQPHETTGWQAALTARLGRRGAQRVVVAARDSAGRRELITTAAGLWRWAFRGGHDREAYRTLLAAGVEWLLAGDQPGTVPVLLGEPVVARGIPVTFRWAGAGPPPDSATLEVTGPDSTARHRIGFGADRTAALPLAPGVYRWRLRGPVAAEGTVAVEEYSPEFVPRARVAPDPRPPALRTARVGLRELWWVFGIAMLAFVAEWAWRLRRGLP